MADRAGASRWVLAAALGLVATTGAEAATRRHADPAPDPRDARITALESQVSDLAAEVRAMKAERQTTGARSAASGVAVPPATAGAVVVGTSAGPQPSTPDTPSPVTASASAPAGGASILAGKPSISSPDGRFVANLHAVMQFDAADYFQRSAQNAALDLRRGGASTDTAHARDLNDGTNFRRARLGVDGKVFGDFEYNVLLEFGGAGAEDAGHIQELWVQYSGIKPFHLRVGAFRPSEGLEDQGSTNGMPFLERPAISDVAASIAGADYREGAQLWAGTDRAFVSGVVTSRNVGTINTTGSSTAQSFDQALGFVGRVAILPVKTDDLLVHLGAHGSYSYQIADAGGPDTAVGAVRYPVQLRERPELRVDGTRLVDTGAIDASHAANAGFETAVQWKNFFLQGEYEGLTIQRRNSLLDNPDFSGWYVEGSWILTGEKRRYNTSTFAFDAPPVDHPFNWQQRTFGAWEAALRFSDLDLNFRQGLAGTAPAADAVRGGEQKIFTAGLNWYLNPVVRFMLDYQHVDIDRLSPSATAYATPVGARVGQQYDTIAIRSQLAF